MNDQRRKKWGEKHILLSKAWFDFKRMPREKSENGKTHSIYSLTLNGKPPQRKCSFSQIFYLADRETFFTASVLEMIMYGVALLHRSLGNKSVFFSSKK